MARDKRPEQLPARDCSVLSLAEFIEYGSGGTLTPPWHLGEYFTLCERLVGGKLHICVSMPPQHAKTTTCEYAIAYALHKHPSTVFGYGSYAKLFSSNRTEEIMRIYVETGGELMKDHARKDDWRTSAGGGCIAFSPGSGIAGYKMHTIVFDDFVENETDLDTEEKRKAIHRDIDRATQRLWVDGSIVCIGTRWHPEDPIGHLLRRGYTELNLPAIRTDDHGVEHALWPDMKPIAWLNQKRLPSSLEYVGEYAWATQYQGKPVPPSGAIFGPPSYYDELPPGAEVVAIGVDIGVSDREVADWSAQVVLACLDGIYYVHDVRRVQLETFKMRESLRDLIHDYPPPVRLASYVSGPEKGILSLLFHEGIPIERLPAKHSKWTRAQRCALAWRTGRVRVRRGQPWTSAFVREVEFFTGNENAKDDQVDALVSAYDLVAANAPVGWASQGFKFGRAVV